MLLLTLRLLTLRQLKTTSNRKRTPRIQCHAVSLFTISTERLIAYIMPVTYLAMFR